MIRKMEIVPHLRSNVSEAVVVEDVMHTWDDACAADVQSTVQHCSETGPGLCLRINSKSTKCLEVPRY